MKVEDYLGLGILAVGGYLIYRLISSIPNLQRAAGEAVQAVGGAVGGVVSTVSSAPSTIAADVGRIVSAPVTVAQGGDPCAWSKGLLWDIPYTACRASLSAMQAVGVPGAIQVTGPGAPTAIQVTRPGAPTAAVSTVQKAFSTPLNEAYYIQRGFTPSAARFLAEGPDVVSRTQRGTEVTTIYKSGAVEIRDLVTGGITASASPGFTATGYSDPRAYYTATKAKTSAGYSTPEAAIAAGGKGVAYAAATGMPASKYSSISGEIVYR